jgi:hypothetical protein
VPAADLDCSQVVLWSAASSWAMAESHTPQNPGGTRTPGAASGEKEAVLSLCPAGLSLAMLQPLPRQSHG